MLVALFDLEGRLVAVAAAAVALETEVALSNQSERIVAGRLDHQLFVGLSSGSACSSRSSHHLMEMAAAGVDPVSAMLRQMD